MQAVFAIIVQDETVQQKNQAHCRRPLDRLRFRPGPAFRSLEIRAGAQTLEHLDNTASGRNQLPDQCDMEILGTAPDNAHSLRRRRAASARGGGANPQGEPLRLAPPIGMPAQRAIHPLGGLPAGLRIAYGCGTPGAHPCHSAYARFVDAPVFQCAVRKRWRSRCGCGIMPRNVFKKDGMWKG